jgi:hypothetical protein
MKGTAKLSKPASDDFDDCYGSNWLGPDDAKKPIHSKPQTWERQTFKGSDGKEKDKIVLTFEGVKKPCVVNKTNALSLAGAYGKSPDGWIGKPVTIRAEMTSFGGKPVRGIRLYPTEAEDVSATY